jgi:ABC-type transport system involved in multi-copper enzyme maturation permease subunit
MNNLISRPLIYYVLMAAMRDKLILSLILFMTVGTCVAIFIGSSAVIEADQFALVFASTGLRLAGMMGLVLFAVFYVRRAFETKDIDFLLSRPVSRTCFIVSHAVALSILAVGVALFAELALLLLASKNIIIDGHVLWMLSLMVEFVIMINVALFFSMVLSSAASAAMAVAGLYILGRMMGQILGIIDEGMKIANFEIMSGVMQLVSLIVPRLDLMAQTTWLVYGPGGDGPGIVLAQGAAYTLLLIVAATIDLRRREF